MTDADTPPAIVPGGTVAFASSGSGVFDVGASCPLPSTGTESCAVSYTPQAAGPRTVSATYSGDTAHEPSSGSTSLVAGPAPSAGGGPVYHPPTYSLQTTITSGPNGLTSGAPTFTFTSSVAGATFECAYDGAPFSACTTPLTTYGLAIGPHTFHVRSVSPAGARDPRPPSRSFRLGTTQTDASCTVLIPWSLHLGPAHPGEEQPDVRCQPALAASCPAGARCTETVSGFLADADRFSIWDVYVDPASWHRDGAAVPDQTAITSNECRDPEVEVRDPTTAGFSHCPTVSAATAPGPGESPSPYCYAFWYANTSLGPGPDPIRGPDDRRRLTWRVSYTIVPDLGLVLAPGVGKVVILVAPGPGLLTITAPAGGAQAAGAAPATARRRPRRHPAPIVPVRRRVRAAGLVSITLRLNAATARILNHRRQLPLHITVRFTPTRGSRVVRHQPLTLVSAACTTPHPKPQRRTHPHKIPAGCPTHR